MKETENDLLTYLNRCACHPAYEDDYQYQNPSGFDTLIWNDEFQAYETVQDAKTREKFLMEELEDFDIPY